MNSGLQHEGQTHHTPSPPSTSMLSALLHKGHISSWHRGMRLNHKVQLSRAELLDGLISVYLRHLHHGQECQTEEKMENRNKKTFNDFELPNNQGLYRTMHSTQCAAA